MAPIIDAQNLSKKYRKLRSDRPTSWLEAIAGGFRHLSAQEEFWALRDLTFSLEAGTVMGLIGRNGVGKTTLLRLLGGALLPDKGTVQVRGRVGGFLELTSGFRDELSGRENIFVNGIVSGMTRAEVRRQFDSIVDFAEVADFIDSPLRMYSTGMRMRLAFAIAAHTEPDLLLIDEVLAVGDLAFQAKCFKRIHQFKQSGCTIFIVSHNGDHLLRLCDQLLWLEAGRLHEQGPPPLLLPRYQAEVAKSSRRSAAVDAPKPHATLREKPTVNVQNESVSLQQAAPAKPAIEIQNVELLDSAGNRIETVQSHHPLTIKLSYKMAGAGLSPRFQLIIHHRDGQKCASLYTEAISPQCPSQSGAGAAIFHLDRLDLAQGQYYLSAGAFSADWSQTYGFQRHMQTITVQAGRSSEGYIDVPFSWEIEQS